MVGGIYGYQPYGGYGNAGYSPYQRNNNNYYSPRQNNVFNQPSLGRGMYDFGSYGYGMPRGGFGGGYGLGGGYGNPGFGGLGGYFTEMLRGLWDLLGNGGGTTTVTPTPCPDPTPTPVPVPSHRGPLVTEKYNGGLDGKIWGDPHIVGFDGERYDVQGEAGKVYNLVSDKNFQMNAQFKGWGNGATSVEKLGIQVGNSKILFDSAGDGPEITTLRNGVENKTKITNGQTITLDKGGSATMKDGVLTVATDEYTVAAKDMGTYIDLDTHISANGPTADAIRPHGLLGQTADGIAGAKNTGVNQGAQGGTVIDGTVNDYVVSDLFGTDDKYNRFNTRLGRVSTGIDNVVDIAYDRDGKVTYARPVDTAYNTTANNFNQKYASQEDKSYVTQTDFVNASIKDGGGWATSNDQNAQLYYGYADRNQDGKLTKEEFALTLQEGDVNGDKVNDTNDASQFVQKLKAWKYDQTQTIPLTT